MRIPLVDSKLISDKTNPPNDIDEYGVYLNILDQGFDLIEKGERAVIDVSVDAGTKYLVKLIPGEKLAELAAGAVVKGAAQSLKDALHEAAQLQRPPMVLDRRIHYPGDEKDPKGSVDLFNPEVRKKFYDELKKPSAPGEIKGVTISIPQPSVSRPQPIEKNLTLIGVPKSDHEKVINEGLKRTNFSLNQLEEKLDKVINWQVAQDEKIRRAQTFQEIEQAVELFGQLGVITGCRELQQFSVFVNAGIEIGKHITTLTSGFAFGPIVGIGCAALSIFSLFMKNGPDPTQIILEQIGKLSEQINDLRRETKDYFLKNSKMQAEILNTICVGFSKLSQQVDRQITGLKTEMYTLQQDLQGRLNFLIRYEQHAHIIQYLTELETACSHVNLYKSEIYSSNITANVVEQGRNLLSWVMEKSSNELLTGRAFLRSLLSHQKDEIIITGEKLNFLSEFLVGDLDAERLNFFLGFFAIYAQKKFNANYNEKEIKDVSVRRKSKIIPPVDSITIPNPLVWFQAIQNYIELYAIFPQLDSEGDEKALEAMIEVGQRGLNFIDHLAHDQVFWEKLLANYHENLKTVRSCAEVYADKYCKERLNELNAAYRQTIISKQDDISALNLLANPDTLISQFAGRSICHLPGDINTGESCLKAFTRLEEDKLHKEFIFEGFKSQIPKEILCAEYLGKIIFSAKCGEIVDSKNEINFHIKERPYYRARLVNRINPQANTLEKKWVYPERIGRDTYTEEPLDSVNIDCREWRLPIGLAYQVKKDGASSSIPVGTLLYTGSWDGFQAQGIGTWKGKEDYVYCDDPYTGVKYIACAYSTPAERDIKFKDQMIKWVRDYWNKPQGKFTLSVTQNSHTSAKAKQEIDEYYLEHRDAIVKTLRLNKAAVPEYKQALEELNISVSLIRWYAYLIGKNMDDPLLNNLVTSEVIDEDLDKYASDKALPDQWLEHITQAFEDKKQEKPKITYQTIQALTQAKSLPLVVSYLISGQIRLRAYQAWRATYKKQFPTLSQYINVQEYERHCETTRNHLFQTRVYKEFERQKAEPFNTAKFKLDAIVNKLLPLGTDGGERLYTECLEAILRWTISESRRELVTQFLLLPISSSDLQEEEIVQLKELYLKPYGWTSNIRFFMRLANQLGKTNFSGFEVDQQGDLKFLDMDSNFKNPANFVMWSEGVYAYLKLILNNPTIEPLAERAHDSTEIRLNTLKTLYAIGRNLKSIISTMALSHPLFTELFSQLLNRFKEPLKFIEMKLGKEHPGFGKLSKDKPKKFDVFRLLATDPYQGARDKLLDELSTHTARILAFLEMCFGYDVQRVPNSNYEIYIGNEKFVLYTDKEKILAYLTENRDKLKSALKDYIRKIKRLRQLVLLRIVYANDVALFRQYLQTYLQNNWPTNKLIIAADQLSTFLLTADKIELIDAFLDARRDIDVIEITDIALDDETLARIMHVLVKYPHITSIRFVNCSLQENSLEILKNYLIHFRKLTSLDLSKNIFTKTNKIEGIFKLAELLEALPSLHELHLVNNHLNDDGLSAVVTALHGRQLSILNLSGNCCATAKTLQEILTTLFLQHPELQALFLSRMGIRAVDLETLAPTVKNLTKLTELDLSGNTFGDSVQQVIQLIHFLENLQPRIRLNLANTCLGENGACAIAATLGHAYVDLIDKPAASKPRALASLEEKSKGKQSDIRNCFVALPLNLRLGQPALDNLLQTLVIARETLVLATKSSKVNLTSSQAASFMVSTSSRERVSAQQVSSTSPVSLANS